MDKNQVVRVWLKLEALWNNDAIKRAKTIISLKCQRIWKTYTNSAGS